MKKQLLLTSALVGLVAGSASAETKITGDYKINYLMGNGLTPAAKAEQGMGRETQINVSKSEALDNGMTFAAGFSFEADGNTVSADEGVFASLSSGDTTVLFGMDKAPNMDTSAVPRVGENARTGLGVFTDTATYAGSYLSYSQDVGTIYGKAGIALIQKTPYGVATLNYVPNTADTSNAANDQAENSDGKDGYEFTFKGNLGVDGLTAYVGKRNSSKNGTDEKDDTGKAYGVGYNMGQIAFGAEKRKRVFGDDGQELDTTEYGVTYSVNDKLSIGYNHAKTDGVNASGTAYTSDEKIDVIQVGYNLGPATLQASYYQTDNVGNTATQDPDLLLLRIGTKF
jgi:hypothetical protein